jgi:hypothetical protein
VAWIEHRENGWLVRWRDQGKGRSKNFRNEDDAVRFKQTPPLPRLRVSQVNNRTNVPKIEETRSRSFTQFLIDCEEDCTLRAVLVGVLESPIDRKEGRISSGARRAAPAASMGASGAGAARRAGGLAEGLEPLLWAAEPARMTCRCLGRGDLGSRHRRALVDCFDLARSLKSRSDQTGATPTALRVEAMALACRGVPRRLVLMLMLLRLVTDSG